MLVCTEYSERLFRERQLCKQLFLINDFKKNEDVYERFNF